MQSLSRMFCSHSALSSRFVVILIFSCFFTISLNILEPVDAAKSKYFLSKPECNDKLLNRTDADVVKLMCFGENGRSLPTDTTQLKPFCKETSRLVNRIESFFKTCYRKDISDLANILVFSIKSQIRVFCGRKTRRLTTLLKSAKCVNDKFIKNSQCLDLFNDLTRKVTLLNDDGLKIKHTCCSYVKAMQCVDDLAKSDTCTAKYSEIYQDLIRSIFGSFTTIMCGEYSEQSTLCDELGPIPATPKGAANSKLIRGNFNSFVFVLLDLLESMKNFDFPTN